MLFLYSCGRSPHSLAALQQHWRWRSGPARAGSRESCRQGRKSYPWLCPSLDRRLDRQQANKQGRQVVWWVPHQRVWFGDATSCRAPNGRLMTLLESPGPHLLLRSHLRPPGIFGDHAVCQESITFFADADGCQKLRSFSACQQHARHHQLSPLGRQEKKKTTRRNSQVSPPLDESFVHLMWQHLGRV